MATEHEQHPADEQILEALELQRVIEENKKMAEKLEAEPAGIEQATADIKINPQGSENIKSIVKTLKTLEAIKVCDYVRASHTIASIDWCAGPVGDARAEQARPG